MAFIIVADSKSHEIDRRELVGPTIIGRAPDCDLPVRDILLSRKHCVIERLGEAWIIADLASKNGTRVNGDPITRHMLKDMDLVRIGRTRIAFREGPFIPAPPDVQRSRQRPADPLEAMAGTLSGFRLSDEEEHELDRRVLETFPRPRPRPVDPRSYQSEKVQAMLMDIASSAWDTVLVETERSPKSTATLPRPMVETALVVPQFAPDVKKKLRKRAPFNANRAIALFYVAFALMVSGLSVWVISWSW